MRGKCEGKLNGKSWQNTRSVKVCMICYGRLQSGEVAMAERSEGSKISRSTAATGP